MLSTVETVFVGAIPDVQDLMRKYSCTDGSCIAEKRSWSLSDKVVDLQRMFHHIAVRDKIDPTVAHAALMGILEYTLACASFKNNTNLFGLPERAVDTLKYFHQMAAKKKIDSQTAHKKLLAVDEYVETVYRGYPSLTMDNTIPG